MSQIAEALAIQLTHLDRLQSLLDQELSLISNRDAEALITLVKEKEALLDAIQALDEKLKTALSSDIEEDVAIADLKQQILSKVEECKYRTKINATAVEQGQLRLEHLRGLIMEARAKESLTYDKAGKKQSGTKSGGISA
ncbi:flagellar export chaperone FlgN [Aliiglaciecola sp. CAU 1673]|uniref:flagellar export chaperone FlgN n=1 Tax=Aliiglaciecola sp. CAU 1673 TaxID=3032595 RepID=UPI0023DAFB07|nr:flagellar export chaperone FlgN [Aliiglaciecola sp. CAU 1673]MDF2178333.1 flagellar export chaperone FlgN [Aliiglaciecola sp. CAU 1673]